MKTGDYLRNGTTVRAIGQPNFWGFIYVEFAPGKDATEGSAHRKDLEEWEPISEAEARALIPDMDKRRKELDDDEQVRNMRNVVDHSLMMAPADKLERVAEMRGYKLTKPSNGR